MSNRWQRSNYRLLLARPGMRRLAVTSLLGRLAFAMTNLSLLLYVTQSTGEVGVAGMAAGTSLLGTAVSASVQGRWFDRHGVRTTLFRLTALYVPLTVLLIVLLKHNAPVTVLLPVILAQSLAMPMMGVASRAVLPHLTPEGPLRDALIRYWTISFEVCYVLAPALVGLLSLGENTAEVPFIAATTSVAFASIAYAASPLVPRSGAVSSADHAAANSNRGNGFQTLMIAALAFGAAVGFVVITVTAIAKDLGNPEMVSLPFSLMTIFSVAGGLLYSHHQPSQARHLQLAVLVAFSAVALLIPTFFDGISMREIILCCVIAGISFAPQLILQSTLVEDICPPDRVGVSFGWLTTAVTIGNATGQTLGGALSEQFSTGVAAGTGAVILTVMALVISLRGHTLLPARSGPGTPA